MQLTNAQKGGLMFLLGCIPLRASFVYIAKYKQEWLRVMSLFALAISIGFTVIYTFKLRKTGQEVFGEKIWWNELRPMHAFLYGLFSYLAVTHPGYAWKPLAADVAVGLVAFTMNRLKA